MSLIYKHSTQELCLQAVDTAQTNLELVSSFTSSLLATASFMHHHNWLNQFQIHVPNIDESSLWNWINLYLPLEIQDQ